MLGEHYFIQKNLIHLQPTINVIAV